MAIRVLMRGGIYVLFIIGVAVTWLLKRRQPASTARPAVTTPGEPLPALQHPHWQVRIEAVRQLALQQHPERLTDLIAMLNDEDSDVRDAAVEAVTSYGAAAAQKLVAVLSEGRLNGREAAARALSIINDPTATPALMSALADESAWVRLQAANALGKSGDLVAAEALTKALEAETDSAARQALETAIATLKTGEENPRRYAD